MCPPPNLTRTSPAAHPRSEMTYSFAVGVLPCAYACALLCVHASVDVCTQAKCVCTLEYAQGIHISLCRSSVAYTQLLCACILAHAQGVHAGRSLRILNLWTHFCVHIRIEPSQNNAFFRVCILISPPKLAGSLILPPKFLFVRNQPPQHTHTRNEYTLRH